MEVKGKKLILLELNEINFEYAKMYAEKYNLSNLKRICNEGVVRTSSESQYECLEPWIQWASAHTGKSFKEHGVFRLGDIVNTKHRQIFEEIEEVGYSVGAISPMNARNDLKKPAYFIPDPWTKTKSDESFWSINLTNALQQAVNDNAQSKLSLKSLFILCMGVIRFARPKNYFQYFKFSLGAIGKPWFKSMFLDLFLNDIHMKLLKSKKPDFSTLFLNAGAHIQHHYLFNSEFYAPKNFSNPDWYIKPDKDPLLDLLKLYDRLISDYVNSDYGLIVATGLTQIPYIKEKFYWRIKNHSEFLEKFNINFKNVSPRMTRDFLIEFHSEKDARDAENKLLGMLSVKDNVQVFEEIDNRGKSIFVTLTYPHRLESSFAVEYEGKEFDIFEDLAFVALKNGMHSSDGYLYCQGVINPKSEGKKHIKSIYKMIKEHFEI